MTAKKYCLNIFFLSFICGAFAASILYKSTAARYKFIKNAYCFSFFFFFLCVCVCERERERERESERAAFVFYKRA